MKLGYRLYIYIGYYFEFSSSNPCSYIALIKNESYRQSPENMRNNGEREKRDKINT